MSKFNKRASLIAAAVALALPGVAMAVEAKFPDGIPTYASNVVNANTTALTVPAGAYFGITASDNLAGRTAGFGVRITLNGAQFQTAPQLEVAEDQEDTTFDGATVALQNTSSNIALYSIGVNTGNTAGMAVGKVLEIGDFVIKNVTAQNVTATIEIFDPTTNASLATAPALLLFNTKQAVTVAFDPTVGDVAKRIDVVDGQNYAAKTAFSPDGSLGGADVWSGWDAEHFNAGAVKLGIAEDDNENPVLAANGQPFQYLAGDEAEFVVTSTGNLEVFAAVTLAQYSNCDGTYAEGEIDGNTVTFSELAANEIVNTNGYLCFWIDGNEGGQIEAQSFTTAGKLDFASNATTDYTAASIAANPLPMKYNGSVIDLYNVNPASNTVQESLLRYTNNSALDYKVTLTGRDDAGEMAAGSISFVLPAGASISLTSKEIESGVPGGRNQQLGYAFEGAGFGAGTGKWKVTATAEGQSLVASGLNRSATTGVISELNGEKHSDPADDAKVKSDWTTGLGPFENSYY